MSLLTEEQVQAAFDWLQSSDEQIASARTRAVISKYEVERVEARLILSSMETSDAKRRAWARAHEDYKKACQEHADAEGEWEMMRRKRERCELIAEVWRTQQANGRGLSRFR